MGQAYLNNKDGARRTYCEHQKEDLSCSNKNIVHLDGRDSGKCLSFDTLIIDCYIGNRIRIGEFVTGQSISVFGPDQKLHINNSYSIL